MRRISGLDLNGWRDVAARDWNPDEPEERLITPLCLDGGIGSVAVCQSEGDWVGGPQALLAPHGRGDGWGKLGAREGRVAIVDIVEALIAGQGGVGDPAFGAAVSAMSRGAQEVILAVPDHPRFDEAAQGRVLAVLRRDRRVYRLLWRPVALFLHALEQGLIPRDVDGVQIRLLVHCDDGIEAQTLRLRKDSDHSGHVAPERDGYGTRILPKLGLKKLHERADATVLAANPILSEARCERSTLPLALLFGRAQPNQSQILRHNNGNWIEIVAPDMPCDAIFELQARDGLADGDGLGEPVFATFLATPLAPVFAERLTEILSPKFPGLLRLEWDGAAQGALLAGRMIEKGLPHYFDRLTPIRLAVRKGVEPLFEDLLRSEATLPANREYVSPPYRDLVWSRGKGEIEFYVMKGDDEVRHWTARLDTAPPRDLPVELRLRQTPGQSWAKLSLTSPDWELLQRNPIFLDWNMLKPVERSPFEVLEQLRTPPPTIPERIVEPANEECWLGSARFNGLLPALQSAGGPHRADLSALSALLGRTIRLEDTGKRTRAIGTDGDYPEKLGPEQVEPFQSVLDRCIQEIQAALARNAPADQAALRLVTWTFTRCPDPIQDAIVAALEARIVGKPHPLQGSSGNQTVLIQGAGRAVAGTARLRRLLHALIASQTNNNTLSALAMVLTRRVEAPHALSNNTVKDILELVSEELKDLTEKGSFKTRFKNALSAAAGLFRYRVVEPYALLAGQDPLADTLDRILSNVVQRLERYSRTRLIEERLVLLESIREFLAGQGDANILALIEDLSDDD